MTRAWLPVVCVAVAVAAPAHASAGFDGTYKVHLTADSLQAVGTPGDLAAADASTWTLTVANGHWRLTQQGGPFGSSHDSGDVKVASTTALFTTRLVDGYPHHVEVGVLRWRLTGDTLRFTLVGRQREDLAGVLAARPWQRVR